MHKAVCVTDLQCGVAAHQYDDGDVVLEIPGHIRSNFLEISKAELLRIAGMPGKPSSRMRKTVASDAPPAEDVDANDGATEGVTPSSSKSQVVIGGQERAGQFVTYMQRSDNRRYFVILEGMGERHERVYRDYDSARRAKLTDVVGKRGRQK